MRIKLAAICALCFLILNFSSSCREAGTSSPGASNNQTTADSGAANPGGEPGAPASDAESATPQPKKTETGEAASNQPKTVRDFFMLLPQKYFRLEGCEPKTDKDCRRAKLDYLKTHVHIEDTENGYLSGGCDGAQGCLDMALFKRPDGSYLVGINTSFEMMEENYFLDYRGGNWADVSSKAVPKFSRKNAYNLPRYGTTVQVFAKKVIEKGADYEVTERGEKLYDLEWENGKFTIKK
ncbi:MAG TPA: hypothetical protein VK400_05115 [Pyrinomonadaceae bacterium]|nr:hypothetical protein [Pyrinomonadaceae bacterium]